MYFSAFFLQTLWGQPAIPCGHSHNDYMQSRPLYTAIELGYGSIEIDVCLDKNNQLKVSHDPVVLSSKKTIEEMYFEPIVKMIEQKDTVFRYNNNYPLILMIDIKTNGDSAYKYLKPVLDKYEPYITQYNYKKDSVIKAPLKICLSGNKPTTPVVEAEEWQLVKNDVSMPYPVHQEFLDFAASVYMLDVLFTIERRSVPYFKFLKYNGIGEPGKRDQLALEWYVTATHKKNKQVRFYAAGNNKKIWKYLLDGGVDWINIDHLKKFARFYKGYLKTK